MKYERQECSSPEDQLVADARGLIAKAAKLSALKGESVDPASLVQRETDFVDGQFEALKAAIAEEQRAVNAAIIGMAETVNVVEVYPSLMTFRADFYADPALRSKISWAEIQTRLLANDGHYLALAQAMEQGGQLFGVDAQGRPLICDRGDEPIMKGMNYENTRDRVLYKHDRNDIEGKMLKDEGGQPIATGYEMFGYKYSGPYPKNDEIRQYEVHTGKHFVQSPNRNEHRSSWLESGKISSWPHHIYSSPRSARSCVSAGSPQYKNASRGVRRLLRVEKAA